VRHGRTPFDWRAMVAEAQTRLSQPPQHPLVRRRPPVGSLVVTFAIPLGLCPTTNGTRRMPNWWYARNRDELFDAMGRQFLMARPRLTRGKALPGRPQIRAVRFCPIEKAGDPCSDWAKSAIDRLILPLRIRREGRLIDCKRFGILEDDDLEHVDEAQWWEPCPASLEHVYIEIRTGE
jgi:hypothetical protein